MYQNILTMMLRMRQLTAHIFLVQHDIKKRISAGYLTIIKKSLTAKARSDNMQIETLKQLRNLVLGKQNLHCSHSDPLPNSPEEPKASSDNVDLAEQFAICLRKLRIKKKWEELTDLKLCQECHGVPENAVVTDCMHVYCKDCLASLADTAAHSGQLHTQCRKCGLAFGRSSSCEGLPELGSDIAAAKKRRWEPKAKPNMAEGLEFVEVKGRILSSAKVQATRAQILEWKNDAPNDKIIVFTQFRML